MPLTRAAWLALAGILLLGRAAAATPSEPGDDAGLSDRAILGPAPGLRLESIRTRFHFLDQDGEGYQSQAGPLLGKGSEHIIVLTPVAEVTVRQGANITHRLEVPLDVISAASPDAVDAVSNASRWNESGSLDFTTTYRADAHTSAFVRGLFHLEENFRAYGFGLGLARGFAEDNTVVSASLNAIDDWFDSYNIYGARTGHRWRTTVNVNLGVTQLLSPTTIVSASYGGTVQHRNLGVTTNSVPLADDTRGPELLPNLRHRHAFQGQLVQALPWRGALHASYRLYADSWGIVAHTAEAALYQYLGPSVYLRLDYRLHHQTAVDFFTSDAAVDAPLRSGDSDLARFTANEYGAKLVWSLGTLGGVREVTLDIGADRYVRSNDMRVSLFSWGVGLQF